MGKKKGSSVGFEGGVNEITEKLWDESYTHVGGRGGVHGSAWRVDVAAVEEVALFMWVAWHNTPMRNVHSTACIHLDLKGALCVVPPQHDTLLTCGIVVSSVLKR